MEQQTKRDIAFEILDKVLDIVIAPEFFEIAKEYGIEEEELIGENKNEE